MAEQATAVIGGPESGAASSSYAAIALHRLAQGLLYALPILFIIGRAPAEIAVSLTAILFLARSACGLGWAWLKTPWVMAAFVFWISLLLTSVLALSPEESFSRALPFLRFFLFAAALQHWLLVERQALHLFLTTLAIAVGFVLIDCLYQYAVGVDIFGKTAEGQFRLSGPFNNDVAGTFLAKVSLPLLGWWFAWSADRGHLSWTVGGVLALVIGLVILLTGERTAFVSYGMGLGVLILLVRNIRRPLLLIGLIGMVGLGSLVVGQKDLRQRFVGHTTSDFEDFWNNRYGIIFVHAIDAWKTAPITGVGLKNFRLTCRTDNFEHKGPIDSWCFNHAHNPYLELLSETGAVGLTLFLVMILLILKDIIQGWRPARQDFPLVAAAAASLLMFLWPVMVSKSLFANWNGMLFWLAIGLALAIARPRLSPQSEVRRRPGMSASSDAIQASTS
ncbi:MAG: O-antigen ligase family protein [Geminicoccaceae bacterium]